MNADGIIIAATNEAIAPYLDMCQVPVVAIDSVLDTRSLRAFSSATMTSMRACPFLKF